MIIVQQEGRSLTTATGISWKTEASWSFQRGSKELIFPVFSFYPDFNIVPLM